MDPLTEEDVHMIYYFWTEKGDLSRWSRWEEKLPAVKEHHPRLWRAWQKYLEAGPALTRAIKNARNEIETDN